jgi:hypothetical protein
MKAAPGYPALEILAVSTLLWAVGPVFGQGAPSPGNAVVPGELSASAEISAKPSAPAHSTGTETAAEIPKLFPVSRYSALFEKSPFAVATAAPEAAPAAENFSTNFVVTGIAKNRGAEGKEVYTVFVRSRDLSTRLVLTGDKPSDEGISVVSVEEAPVAAKSSVVLKKGSETGRVEFDQAALAASSGGGQLPAPQAGKSGASGAKAPTSAAARPSIPRPGMTAVPRPGASLNPPPPSAPAAGNVPSGSTGGQELRRRVRPIQGAPGAAPEPQ